MIRRSAGDGWRVCPAVTGCSGRGRKMNILTGSCINWSEGKFQKVFNLIIFVGTGFAVIRVISKS